MTDLVFVVIGMGLDTNLKPAFSPSPRTYALVALIGLGLGWAYWPALADMVRRWWGEAMYSHGFLVPLFSAYLLYARRNQLDVSACRPSWWGLLVLLLGSLAVEDFSVRRISDADDREIESRLSTLVDMISLGAAGTK